MSQIDLNFDPKLFQKCFYDYRKVKTRYAVVYGGSHSSKSYSVHQAELINLLDPKQKGDILFIRKYASDLHDSCYMLLKNIIDAWNIRFMFQIAFSNQKRQITNNVSGRRILFRGLDDTSKIKSIAGISTVIIEEAEQVTTEDILEITRRARGADNIRITFIFNPVRQDLPVKQLLFDSGAFNDTTTYLHYTYKDNLEYVTKDDIAAFEIMRQVKPNDYRVYALGSWGLLDVESRWAYSWQEKYIQPCTLNPALPVHISFDFNIAPSTAIIFQYQYLKYFHVIDEFKANNIGLKQFCQQIKNSKYGNLHYIITGDATGKNRSALSGNVTAYSIIKNELNLSPGQIKVMGVNPKHSESRTLSNHIIALHPDFRIDPKCESLINDLNYVEGKDDDGFKLPDKGYGHLLDTLRYAFNTFLPRFVKDSISIGAKQKEKEVEFKPLPKSLF